jgi:hypothetical protein
MVHALADPETARNTACAATLLCVWLSAHYAQKIRQERPRAFTALSLLALNWAILLLYYLPGTPDTEILSSFGGFVLITIGALLHQEAMADEPIADPPTITWLDTLPLFLFRSTVLCPFAYFPRIGSRVR